MVITDFLPKMAEWQELIKTIGSEWDFMFLELDKGMGMKAREAAIYERLLELKTRLEALTGSEITDEDISRSIEVTNGVTRIFSEIDELIKTEPHPLRSFDIYNLKVIFTDYIGGDVYRLLDACNLLRDELVERIEAEVGYDGKKLLLAGGFRNEFLHAIEGNGGIVTAGWPYQRFTAHRKAIQGDDLVALAKWYAGHSGVGGAHENARDFADLVRYYDVDGVIYNRQCPFGSLEVYDSHDAIRDAVDVPFLTIEADEDEAEAKIGEFLRKL
jgi:benzoyl-CoA reductase/2-hydroxyglutaryl-CoA dehydratase subunit BcrC/BadD/HgdB